MSLMTFTHTWLSHTVHCSPAEIRTAYRMAARKVHPDRNPGSEAAFKELQEGTISRGSSPAVSSLSLSLSLSLFPFPLSLNLCSSLFLARSCLGDAHPIAGQGAEQVVCAPLLGIIQNLVR